MVETRPGERTSGTATAVAFRRALDGVHDDDPQARFAFGIRAGPDELIFQREVY